jgi:nucleoside-diphosphate-sugar epimerase
MKVLFIGGTGLISTACTALAIERGIDLYLLNRGERSADVPAGAKLLRADIHKLEDVERALQGMQFDSVVDWICYTPQQAHIDLRLFKERTSQFIFISSASVYQKPLTHYLITESTPLANPYWEYSRNKIACEEIFTHEYRQSGFPAVIVRPSLTFGPPIIPSTFYSWSKPWTLVDRIRKGRPIAVHGDGSSLWVTTHNTDFAKGLVGLLGHQQATGHAFHITTDEVLTWNQIYEAIGRVAGAEPKLVHIPTDFIVSHLPETRGGLLGDKTWSVVFDNSKIKRFVPDFVATKTLLQGVGESFAWLNADISRQGLDDPSNQKIDGLIAAYPNK